MEVLMQGHNALVVTVLGRCNVDPAIFAAQNKNTRYRGVWTDMTYGVHRLSSSGFTSGGITRIKHLVEGNERVCACPVGDKLCGTLMSVRSVTKTAFEPAGTTASGGCHKPYTGLSSKFAQLPLAVALVLIAASKPVDTAEVITQHLNPFHCPEVQDLVGEPSDWRLHCWDTALVHATMIVCGGRMSSLDLCKETLSETGEEVNI
jgi:hypothetical protein